MKYSNPTYLATAQAWLLDHGTRLLISLLVLYIGLKLIKVISNRLRNRMSRIKVHASLQPFLLSLSITAFYVALILLVLNINGYELSAFTGILGGATVAIGLALSGTFQNFAGGVLILLLKPFLLDDYILAQGQEGTVTSIQIFYTVLITPDNKTIIIPNGKLFNEVITNVTRQHKRRVDFQIRLGYYVDIDQVKQIMNDAIKTMPTVIQGEVTRVGVTDLDVEGMRFTINVWVLPDDYLTTKIALQEAILKNLKAAGVRLLGT
jgi:small conductance mechanosensitive channel